MSESDVLVETRGGVRTITFNRPSKKNAFTRAMYERIVELIDEAGADDSVRALLLRGAGGCFTAGNDLKDFMQEPPTGTDSAVFQLLLRLHAFQKPMVAAVQGPAIGLGTTMLLHCDLVFAGEGVLFQMPFVDLGLCPEGASTLLLPRMMGHQRASELLLLGERFGAQQAYDLGLVNHVCADDEVVTVAEQAAAKLAAKPPASIRLTKQLLREAISPRTQETLYREAGHFMQRLVSEEAREAFTAFFEKRKPDFSRFS
jgi:enoyl-CoA hydratase/carnithine racemase